MKWYLKVVKMYAVFSGRARRKEYWTFVLFNVLFVFAAMLVDNLLGTTFKINSLYGTQQLPYGYVYLLYSLAVFLPGLGVAVRRLHDVGKSGWMLLVALIPLVGAIWLLVLLVKDSDPGENHYGPNPKGEGEFELEMHDANR